MIMRIRAKSYLIYSVIFVLCATLLSCRTLSQSGKGKSISDNSSANEDIVKLCGELINLRQDAVEQTKRLIQYGRASQLELAEAEMKAAEARIQLAEFQGKKETVLEELQNLVGVITEMRNSIKSDVEVGRRSQTELIEIDTRLIEIKIRLAKLKQEQE
jgi:hypothetical protein